MPRLALRVEPGAPPEALARLADGWEELLGRSARPVSVSRTLQPGLAAVNVLPGFFPNLPQPAVSRDGRLSLWLDGELWDRPAARRRAGVTASEPLTDPELCLRLFEREGERFCEGLNGQFVVVVWDSARERLLVCNDRYAFRPLFWSEGDGAFTCGSEAKSVLRALGRQPELDPAGVLELFAFQHGMADRTLFRDVRTLLPASRLTWERGRTTHERYWRFRYPAQPTREPERDLVQELAHLVRQACARQCEGPGRVGMALSAGLDSRIVAAALPSAEEPLPAYTIGYDNSLDVAGARELARQYRLRHFQLVPHEHYMSRVAAEVVWRTEGAFPFVNATSVQFHERIRPELDIILAGHAGGDLSGQLLLPLPPGSRPDAETYLFDRKLALPEGELRTLFTGRAWQEEWPAFRSRFRETVEELGDNRRRLPDAITAWCFEQGESRFTNHSGQADRYDFEVRAPLLDYEVVDFFLKLPYGLRFAQRLYKRTLAEAFPEAARIPWSKTGKPVPGTAAAILGEYYLGGAQRKLRKLLPRKSGYRTRGPELIGQDIREDRALRTEILEPFLEGGVFPDAVLDRETARRLLDEHWRGERNHWHVLATLATLALVYRHFLERGLEMPGEDCGAETLAIAA